MTIDQLADEIMETLWVMKEQGGIDAEGRFDCHELCRILEAMGSFAEDQSFDQVVAGLVEGGLLTRDGNHLAWTAEGEAGSRSITRRHRLAERLLSDVFLLAGPDVESSACRFEHILSPEVEESICAFLGHPPICPHGRPIPSGRCCGKFSSDVRALVVPLRELQAGDAAKIVFISTKDSARLEKLGLFGIMPDNEIILRQKHPTFVVQSAQTEIAIDSEIAREIFVKKMPSR